MLKPPYDIVIYKQAADFLDHLQQSQPQDWQDIDHELYRLACFYPNPRQYMPTVRIWRPKRSRQGKAKITYMRLRVRGYRVLFTYDHPLGQLHVILADKKKKSTTFDNLDI